jgi:hypothetical protein
MISLKTPAAALLPFAPSFTDSTVLYKTREFIIELLLCRNKKSVRRTITAL